MTIVWAWDVHPLQSYQAKHQFENNKNQVMVVGARNLIYTAILTILFQIP